jgi:membrane associated rhomboid family serine protease
MIPLRDTQPSATTPFITLALIGINVLVFLFQVSLDPFSRNHFMAVFGLVPDAWPQQAWTPLLTHMFLHGGWLHLIGNCWFLWIFGDNVEDVLGPGRFLLFYVGCGLAAGLVQMWINPDLRIPIVGASGAIAGVMGAYLVKFPHSHILTLIPIFVFFTTIEVPAALMLVYWFAIQIISGAGSVGQSQVSQGGVAWFAHVGGFVAGILLIFLLPTHPRYRHRSDLQW